MLQASHPLALYTCDHDGIIFSSSGGLRLDEMEFDGTESEGEDDDYLMLDNNDSGCVASDAGE